jgi:hypothetical protein
MNDLEAYLKQTLVGNMKPTKDMINLTAIQEAMWKQKNYTEAKRVKEDIIKLGKKNWLKFNEGRNEKIRVQLNHLRIKHEQEHKVLTKKLGNLLAEVNRQRKREQDVLLQKLLNIKS